MNITEEQKHTDIVLGMSKFKKKYGLEKNCLKITKLLELHSDK